MCSDGRLPAVETQQEVFVSVAVSLGYVSVIGNYADGRCVCVCTSVHMLLQVREMHYGSLCAAATQGPVSTAKLSPPVPLAVILSNVHL